MNSNELNQLLDDAIIAHKVPGATCGVWTNGEFISAQSGVLNTVSNDVVKPLSMFQIGSISKVLTATLVMILVDQEKLSLDQPVIDFIKDFGVGDRDVSKSVTVRQLLNHTSGIAGDYMPDTGLGPDSLERYLDKYALLPQCHALGEGFSYSNAAYCIAGLLIERVSGLSFDQAMKTLLFEPLGLKNSVVSPLDIPGRSASAGHSPNPENTSEMVPTPNIYYIAASSAPAGATIMMNAEDLITFARMHLNGGKSDAGVQVLSSASVECMQEIGVTIPIPQRDISHWGLGWFFLEQGDQTLFGHDGGTIGQSAFLRIHKPSNTVVCLMVNGGNANDCMFDVFSKTLEPFTGFTHTPAPSPSDKRPDDLAKYEGRYETIATVTDFWVDDGKLMQKAVMTLNEHVFPEPVSSLVYAGNNMFLNQPSSGGRPSIVAFMEPDETGIPQVLFSGLRVARRSGPALKPN